MLYGEARWPKRSRCRTGNTPRSFGLAESIGSNPTAERLGIPQSTMSSWVRRARQDNIEPTAAPAVPTRRAPSELEAEVSRLRREVASLKVDNEVLRKATAYFVKVSR